MKKLFVLVFVIALSLCALTIGASAASSAPAGGGTADDPYRIGTAEELKWFAGLVNGTLTDDTQQNSAACAVLTADIDLNGSAENKFTPIGISGHYYTGTFDGMGCEIKGLYIDSNENETKYVGLFGYIGVGGILRNIRVVDGSVSYSGYLSTMDYNNYVGGICGYNNNGTISGCYFRGKVFATDCSTSRIGGICGFSDHGEITGCSSESKVWVKSISTGLKVGGICGYSDYCVISECFNGGEVSGVDNTGGICGYNFHGKIVNCHNKGNVSSDYTRGDVGGICGYNFGSGRISCCYSTGEITGSRDAAGVGGVCGRTDSGYIENCYWLTGTAAVGVGSGTAACVESKHSSEFSSGEVALLLYRAAGEKVWKVGDDGYPVLDTVGDAELLQVTLKNGGESRVFATNKGETLKVLPTLADNLVVTDAVGNIIDLGTKAFSEDTTLYIRTFVTVIADSFDLFVGDKEPVLTYTTSPEYSFAEAPELACEMDMYSAGEYPIKISGPEYDDAHVFAYVDGMLTVRESWLVTVEGTVYYVHPGDSFEMPDAPSRPGLIFMGWTDGSVTHQAGEKIEVSSDLSFKSTWANLPDIEPDEPDKPVEPKLPFYDVNANDWFFDAVCSVYYSDLMNGVTDTLFDPDGTLTRAMFWTMLARVDGVDTTGGETWYSKAQDWVIAKGVSDGEDPTGALTREQLVTMLWRLNGEPVVNYLITAPDASQISDWALEAMRWAASTGLIEGDETGALTPTANTTRAQAATFMVRYLKTDIA